MDLSNTQISQKILSILKPLLHEHVPNYIDGGLQIKPLTGCTNQVFKIILQHNKPIVFRWLSPIVDRDMQGKIIVELSNAGIIPKCYFTSLEYRIDSFVENGRHPQSIQIISNCYILKAIVQKICAFHQIKLSARISKNIMIQQIFNQENIKSYQQAVADSSYNLKQYQNLQRILINQLDNMELWLHKNFDHKKQTIKFCHNDLNNLNIFIRDISDIKKQAILIDFDYIGYNYIAYDLANFLNQTSIQYTKTYPGFKVARKLTKQQIEQTCSYYPGKYMGLEQDIRKMLVLVNYYWALWSIKIKPTPNNPAFCPLQHGIARWELAKYYKNICQV